MPTKPHTFPSASTESPPRTKAPTGQKGRQVTFTGVTIYRIIDGKVAECWWNRDTTGLMQQLGAPEEALSS